MPNDEPCSVCCRQDGLVERRMHFGIQRMVCRHCWEAWFKHPFDAAPLIRLETILNNASNMARDLSNQLGDDYQSASPMPPTQMSLAIYRAEAVEALLCEASAVYAGDIDPTAAGRGFTR